MQEYTSKIRSLSAELMNIVTNLLLLFFIAPRSRQLSNEELLIPKMVRRTHTILTSSLKDTIEHSAIYLPKHDSLKQTIRRARKRALNVPLESYSFNTLVIPEAYKKTNKGEGFLLYDSGTSSENERLIIFGTASNIVMLNTSSIWIWKFLEVLKKEQDLVEVKQAFCISGRKTTERKLYRDKEQALKNLVENYLSRPKLEFLKGIAYQFAFID